MVALEKCICVILWLFQLVLRIAPPAKPETTNSHVCIFGASLVIRMAQRTQWSQHMLPTFITYPFVWLL